MQQRSFLAVLVLGFLAVSLRAGDGGCQCSSDLSVTVSRGAASRATTNITQTEFMFTAKTVTINVGDTVTWTNNGTIAHTSTSDTGVWDSSTMNPGQSFSFTFMNAGTFPFHCSFHQSLGMVGTVTVNAVNPNPNPNPTPSGTPTAPTMPTTNTATVQFRVKSSDTNGSLSKFTEKFDVTSFASQLPKGRSGKPTLVGLSNIYLFVGSATFTGTIDAKGKVTGPFTAKIAGTGLLTIQAKGLNLVSLFGLTLTADGSFTVPNQTAVIVANTSAQTTLFSGFGGTTTVSYTVKKGTAIAK